MLFVGFANDKNKFTEICSKDRNSHVSAYKLQWNIINGIEEASGQHIDLVSSLLVSDYPDYPGIFIKGEKWSHSEKSNDIMIPFINIIIIKHITRFLSCLWYVMRWMINNRDDKDRKIFVYALHSPFVFSVLMLCKVFGGKIILIIPDMPMYVDMGLKRTFIRKITKPVDNYLLTNTIKRMDGLIVLTEKIATEFASGVPHLVIEGAVSFDDIDSSNVNLTFRAMCKNKNTVMFAGRLTEIAGIGLLLESFKLISSPDYCLLIFGKGPMEAEIEIASQRDSRIVYGGLLPSEEIMDVSKEVKVLVTLGLSKYHLLHYSFPSKLLEYMKTGTPVIATKPGIESEYYDYIYLLEDETPSGLAKLIQEVCSNSKYNLDTFGQKAKIWVTKNKSYIRQGQKIYDFLCKI